MPRKEVIKKRTMKDSFTDKDIRALENALYSARYNKSIKSQVPWNTTLSMEKFKEKKFYLYKKTGEGAYTLQQAYGEYLAGRMVMLLNKARKDAEKLPEKLKDVKFKLPEKRNPVSTFEELLKRKKRIGKVFGGYKVSDAVDYLIERVKWESLQADPNYYKLPKSEKKLAKYRNRLPQEERRVETTGSLAVTAIANLFFALNELAADENIKTLLTELKNYSTSFILEWWSTSRSHVDIVFNYGDTDFMGENPQLTRDVLVSWREYLRSRS